MTMYDYGRLCMSKFDYLLPHSAPSWILSLAENLASSSLQDGATKCLYYVPEATHPPSHPPTA